MKNIEKYKDILEYIELRLNLLSSLNTLEHTKNINEKDFVKIQIEQLQTEIDKWLNKETI